ncbi:hypothetical protein AAFF_G00293680 [Aldrovandia affinis]|uniref:Uncharacterized protein n=1 Tax=Aldrovandia affinis TaxID=143900 RepID=A0AAD7R9D1_9TELE|nr:hypothetical protein AAFF_G00293680 [Aldrovandia affinis]
MPNLPLVCCGFLESLTPVLPPLSSPHAQRGRLFPRRRKVELLHLSSLAGGRHGERGTQCRRRLSSRCDLPLKLPQNTRGWLESEIACLSHARSHRAIRTLGHVSLQNIFRTWIPTSLKKCTFSTTLTLAFFKIQQTKKNIILISIMIENDLI